MTIGSTSGLGELGQVKSCFTPVVAGIEGFADQGDPNSVLRGFTQTGSGLGVIIQPTVATDISTLSTTAGGSTFATGPDPLQSLWGSFEILTLSGSKLIRELHFPISELNAIIERAAAFPTTGTGVYCGLALHNKPDLADGYIVCWGTWDRSDGSRYIFTRDSNTNVLLADSGGTGHVIAYAENSIEPLNDGVREYCRQSRVVGIDADGTGNTNQDETRFNLAIDWSTTENLYLSVFVGSEGVGGAGATQAVPAGYAYRCQGKYFGNNPDNSFDFLSQY